MLAALALAAQAPPPRIPLSSASARATATIRIISGATIRWDERSPDLPRLRTARLRGSGQSQTLRLVEFE